MAVLEVGPAESLSVPGDPQRTPAGCKALWPKHVSAALGSEPRALRGTSQTVNMSTCPETPQERGQSSCADGAPHARGFSGPLRNILRDRPLCFSFLKLLVRSVLGSQERGFSILLPHYNHPGNPKTKTGSLASSSLTPNLPGVGEQSSWAQEKLPELRTGDIPMPSPWVPTARELGTSTSCEALGGSPSVISPSAPRASSSPAC